MKTEVKILLYPNEHKSKNGYFFEDLMRSVFKTQGYEIQQNINFTGLEIDLLAKHIDRNETLLIECKAKQKPKSTELKNFAFNVFDREVDFGYFVYTEELDHQAAGLKEEWGKKEKYRNLTFFGPQKIISSLENSGKISQLDLTEIEKNETINKKILAYTYFGVFYIIIPFSGTAKKTYYLFDKNGKQIENIDTIADRKHSGIISIDKALKNGIKELKQLEFCLFSTKKKIQEIKRTNQKVDSSKIIKFAVLYPDPLDKNFDFSFSDIQNKLKNRAIYVDFYFLSIENLQQIEGYDYVFILTKSFKNKVYIENEYLESKLISLNELLDNYIGDSKATILFTSEQLEIDNINIPLILINYSNKKGLKKSLQNFFFNAFQRNDIKQLNNKTIKIYNVQQSNLLKLEKGFADINYQKTRLPEELASKKFHGFVGRKNDQQNITKAILELENNGLVLNIKGAGGIGKTTIISKVVHQISLRGYFKQGISFVSCEFIQSYKTFEAKIAQCFSLNNIINLREHLNDNFSRLDALIILDNFETLLTLVNKQEIDDIKELVEFISNYSSIVITSREKIGYDFENIYQLENLTTDEALELFQKNYKIKIRNKEEERILRSGIIENLLNNNPLAIKLITPNLPNNLEVIVLKTELEEDFEIFIKTSKDIDKIFDKTADLNIERTRSLFQSINYSYQKLNSRTKLAFELLHLFPDGITHKNFKECFSRKNKSANNISDIDIRILENKSLLENNSGQIKLQSIIGRFAYYQFAQRSDEEKARYYYDAYDINSTFIEIINDIDNQNESLAYSLFDRYSNNFINVLKYIDKIPLNIDLGKKPFINYIFTLTNYILSEGNIISFLRKLEDKVDYFKDYKNAELFLKILKISFVFHHRIFDKPYNELQNELPLSQIQDVEITDYLVETYIGKAFHLYSYEGFTLENIKWLIKYEFYSAMTIFYLGNFDFIKTNEGFYDYEKELNKEELQTKELKEYISNRYEKEHLEKLQCTYTLSKIERVEFDTIQKLVVTNPYSMGLKSLMFAFIEEKPQEKIKLFENAIENLNHIKYYYIEAIYFYSKYLKSIQHSDYDKWFNKGFELADKFYYRFQKHRFLCLKENVEVEYNENDYPLPEDINLDEYVRKYNEDYSNDNIHKERKELDNTIKTKIPQIIYVEGKTDKKILNKAISLFSDKLSNVEIKTDTSKDGAGTDWVRKSIISFATNPDKNKGKAIAILDNDKAGIETHKEITENSDYKKDAKKGLAKSYLIGKDTKPKHILEFYQKNVFHKKSDYGIAIETFFPLKYWQIAKNKGWLENVKDISTYLLKTAPNQPAQDFVIEKGIDKEKLLFIFSKFNNDYKDKFANYMCNLEYNEQKKAFEELEIIINKIETFFDNSL